VKTLARVLATLALLLVIAAGGLVWYAGSDDALQRAAREAISRSGGRLSIDGLTGSLTGSLQARRLVWRDHGLVIEANDVRLIWSPGMLTSRRALVNQVSIARLDVSLPPPDGKPVVLPENLGLPLQVQLIQADIAALNVRNGSTDIVALTDLRFAYRGNEKAHELDLARVASVFGGLQGTLRMNAQAPFTLAGRLNADPRITGLAQATIALTGDLRDLRANANVRLSEGSANAVLRVAPFDSAPLRQLIASGDGVNLAAFNAALPPTVLKLQVLGEGKQGGLVGEFSLENGKTGTLDKKLLPLKEASGHFAGDAKLLKLSELKLDFGGGGQFTGAGSLDPAGVNLDLLTRNFNLRGVHAALKPTQLAGRIQARAEEAKQSVNAEIAQGKLRMLLAAERAGEDLTVSKAELRSGSALFAGQGSLKLTGENAFNVTGKLARFNPAEFGELPVASINAALAARGRLSPARRAAVDVRIADSRLRGQPLSGEAKFNADAQRVSDALVRLDLGGNRINATGALGRPGDNLAFRIDAPHLGAALPQWTGNVRAEGHVRGPFTRPALAVKLDAREIKAPGERKLAEVAGHIEVGEGADRALAVDLRGKGLAASGVTLESVALSVKGSVASHVISASAQQPGQVDFNARAEGGWNEKAGWQGRVSQLENRGTFPLKLKGAAPLAVGRDSFSLTGADLALTPGSLRIDELAWKDAKLSSHGAMAGVPAAWVLNRAVDPSVLESNLTLAGQWSVRLDDHANATLDLARDAGDITIISNVPGEPRLALGLSRLSLKGRIEQNRVHGELDLISSRLGDAKGVIDTTLAQRGGRWGLPGDAPLKASLTAGVRSIAPVMPLVSADIAAEGKLGLEVKAEGTVARPNLRGTIAGDELRIESPAYGLFWRRGVVRASFDERNLTLTEMLFHAGPGQLTATGSARLGGGSAQSNVQWKADKFAVLARPDVRLTITGEGSLALQDRKLMVRGQARADAGAVELLSSIPRLGDDVLVVRRDAKQVPPAARAAPTRIASDIDVSFDLGDKFTVVGKGLDARTTGSIRLKGSGANLNAEGTIRVAQGEFQAYGRRLQIERGTLVFAGPVDNPAVNIRAMRKNQVVEAGVEVTGTARNPQVTLVSSPEVAENEKLSWLVLGHGTDSTKGGDITLLQAAQAALGAVLADKSGADSLKRQFTKATGLDEIRIKGGAEATSQTLELGARLSERVYVTYEQGLAAASRALRLNFVLTPRWTLRAENGATSAVDLFYTISFD
jgi:translocation and assembly module TamB